MRYLKWIAVATGCIALFSDAHAQAPSVSEAVNLIAEAPEGTWVKLNKNELQTVWTPIDLRPTVAYSPDSVIAAWGAASWDTTRRQALLHGGGHANYSGNEVYSWNAVTRLWQRNSLPSELTNLPNNQYTSTIGFMPVDGHLKAAPNSCHNFASMVYLSVVDRMVAFCGGGYQTGRTNIFRRLNGTHFYPGPFLFDPSKSDPNKVGGSQGSHVKRVAQFADPNSIAAGNMWEGRGLWESLPIGQGPAFLNSSAVAREEAGKQVVYVSGSVDNGASAMFLYRYNINSLSDPSLDTWTKVGQYANAVAFGGGGAVIEPSLNVYVRPSGYANRFMYWRLAANVQGAWNNNDIGIIPSEPTGRFTGVHNSSMTYDTLRNKILVWNGGGEIWQLTPPATVSPNGWSLTPLPFSGAQLPGIPQNGAQNRFFYVSAFDAPVAILNGTVGEVWAYKPVGWQRPADSPNLPPTVSLTLTPSSGIAPVTVAASAQATDPDGRVQKVDFYVNDVLAVSDTTAPYATNLNFTEPGTYVVKAIATDTLGLASQVATQTIVVAANQPPIARIVATATSGTTATNFGFNGATSSDPDGTIASYAWNFGDNTSANTASANKTFATPGTYTVSLTVTDNRGLTNTVTETITVTAVPVNQPPSARIVATPGAGTLATQFSFSGSTSTDADGTIASYAWTFGDTTTGTGQTATKTYTAIGTYTVTLTVTDNQGATNVASTTVTVSNTPPPNQPPVARIVATPTSGTTATAFALSGTTSTDSDGTISSYAWSFGDNSAVVTTPTTTKTYATAGTYTVTLTVTDNQAATHSTTQTITVSTAAPSNVPPVARIVVAAPSNGNGTTTTVFSFDASTSSDADGSIASYLWDFGNNETATGSTTTKTFSTAGTYTVTLTVTDNQGATHSTTRTISVGAANVPPVARMIVSPSTGTTATEFTFDAATSTDADGTIANYLWDFGNGTTATGALTTKTFSTPGTYTVSLTVTDNQGATQSVAQTFTVSAPANVPPVARIVVTPSTGTTTTAFAFDASTSSDSDGSVVSYLWNFGDNSATVSTASATKTYATAGTYTVTLTVTDNQGATNITTQSITVSTTPPTNLPPVARIVMSPTTGTTATTFTFDGATSTDADGTITNYLWDFGNSVTASGVSTTKTFAVAGTYTVTLTVTDNLGAINVATQTVTVSAPANIAPVARIVVTPTTGTTATAFAFDGSTSSDADGTITAYSWNFGDNSALVTSANATRAFATAGTFNVVLTVTDNQGATHSTTQSIVVSGVATGQAPKMMFEREIVLTVSDGTVSTLLVDNVAHPFSVTGAQVRFTLTADTQVTKNVVITATGPNGTTSRTLAISVP